MSAGIDQGQIRIAGAGVSKKYDEDFKNRRVEIVIRPIFTGV
jgi:outer membrane protein OmpA-like peptidoglycan-associated protein